MSSKWILIILAVIFTIDMANAIEESKDALCHTIASCPGIKGAAGERGPLGDEGRRGRRGMHYGTGEQYFLKPAPCMDATETGREKIFINGTFELECRPETKSMCVVENNKKLNETTLNKVSVALSNSPFWMSSRKNNFFEDLYHGYKPKQLAYLSKTASSFEQEIRIHCINTKVIPNDEKDLAIRLMTDRVLGPEPNDHSSSYYKTIFNGCEDAGTGWSHADLTVNGMLSNIPVVDVHIRVLETNENQRVYVENKKLCFNYVRN